MKRKRLFGDHDTAGEKSRAAKLTDAKVLAIRRRADAGESQKALAREYGVCAAAIGRIVLGKAWKHLLPGDER